MIHAMNEIVENQKAYLLSCWLPSGTFRLAPKNNQINPYFTNLALIALVRMQEWDCVRSHIEWYLHHVNADGYVNDYRLEGTLEVDTGKADSEDSYHTTLFSLLAEMMRANEETAWVEPYKDELIVLMQAVARLQQKDGLTWAKRSYRVKYLMDNCEVAKGFADAAHVFSMLGCDEAAEEANRRAAACRAGIQSMYSALRKSYAVYDRSYPGWRKWYPDVTSQAFPILYQMARPDEYVLLYEKITKAFPHFDTFQTGDLYPWMAMGECARLMGDWRRVDSMLTTAAELYIFGPRSPYWLIHESGRFVELSLFSRPL
ncbi:hypothetical protein P9761_17665 [Brevibacillus centrosporus]|nr:hypothetical protein [Brevibacillus centrosporus]MED4910012.1 hypothetical protein [Brevibacillus centrosporus]RNB74013.1 hypothetical protein EDM55_00955 [Brevibacillus centrosporus]